MYESNAIRSDYVRFGKSERYISELFHKRQKNQNSSDNKKEEEEKKKEMPDESEFVDRSFCISASLHSLALINAVKLGNKASNHINTFIDDKLTQISDDTNPFYRAS